MRINLDNLKLGQKALLPLGVCGALFTLVLGLGIVRLNQIASEYANLVERTDLALTKVMQANRLASQIGYGNHVILDFQSGNPVSLQAQAQLKAASETAPALLKEASALIPAQAKTLGSFEERFEDIAKQSKSPVERALAVPGVDDATKLTHAELEETAKVAKLLDAIDLKIQGLDRDITKFNDQRLAETAQASVELHKTSDNTVFILVLAGAVSIVVGAALSLWLSRSSVVSPILKLADEMAKIADNDLRVEVDGLTRADEVGVMARALQKFKKNALAWQASDARVAEERKKSEEERRESEARILQNERSIVAQSIGLGLSRLSSKDLTHRITEDLPEAYRQLQSDFNAALSLLEGAMGHVADGANLIGVATMEIAGAADDLARRTEQQAASIEESVAAISEITSTVSKTASGAKHATEIVSLSRADAAKSGEIVQQAVDAMNRIAKSSESIAQIIGVIDEIAFQTNLLALNAGVEAARAGESGRGFAVVASEVRSLAQRSAEAAKEIKGLISTSSGQVGEGVRLVVDAGNALVRIVEAIAEIDGVVAEIAIGTREQSTSLQQINIAVSQMDQDVQKNAAMVEETTAATHNLKGQATELIKSIASFKLGQSQRALSGGHRAASRPMQPKLRAIGGMGREAAARNIQLEPSAAEWTEF